MSRPTPAVLSIGRFHPQSDAAFLLDVLSQTTQHVKEATHLKHFPKFSDLQQEVDRALLHFAQTPREITVLMARYGEKLGRVDKAS